MITADTVGPKRALLDAGRTAVRRAGDLVARARERLARTLAPGGRLDAEALERAQTAAHGLAWYETYRQALAQMQAWAERLREGGRFGERERLLFETAFAEYLARMAGGLPM